MSTNNLDIAVAYYTAMAEKNIPELEKRLHPDVKFIGPLAEVQGKEAVLEAARNFSNFLKGITIQAKFSDDNHAMLAYEMHCPAPIGSFRAATLMTLKDGLIYKLELFYDARPFAAKKEEIFT